MEKNKSVKIVWKNAPSKLKIETVYGKLKSIESADGNGKTKGDSATFSSSGSASLLVNVSDAKVSIGSFATIIKVLCGKKSFSFFLRDALQPENPVWISEYQVAALPAEDKRSYDEIAEDLASKNILSDFARFENEPEESFDAAVARNRKQSCPTWLGIARDMRIFRFSAQNNFGYFGYIEAAYHSQIHKISRDTEFTHWGNAGSYNIGFVVGQGTSCRLEVKRRLEEGCLPILRGEQKESFMSYQLTAFASLETRVLSAENVRGSDWLAAYANSGGCMLSNDEREGIKNLLDKEMYDREEEVVLLCRVEALNTGKSPCYAYFKVPTVNLPHKFDRENGFCILEQWDNGIYAVSSANGIPAEEEMAVLVQPGKKCVFEMKIPHSPITKKRAIALKKMDFDKHLEAARKYWKAKLSEAAQFNVPELKINEMIKAGLLHCDIAAIGKEPAGPVAATIGWYSPIGSESSPIIQYFDSVGMHKLAERSIEFFLRRQREDGFIQNFGGYQLETGPTLWTMGEHFRYTRDIKWVKRVKKHIIKACDYILAWRERNKKEEYRGKGFYGIIEGKVADPNDFYHSFMLNGVSYLGLKRAVEMLAKVDPKYAKQLESEIVEYKEDIRNAFYFTMGKSPVIPAGDGSWVPLVGPWVEGNGGIPLYADGELCFSHGAFASRGCLIGALYLVISEVLDVNEIGTDLLLKANQFPTTLENAGLTQPYYCRHDHAHLKRGEVKAFLKMFYNQLTGLADLETYSFWEHYWLVSQHKTHEEGWFLMQTRWMLYMEEGNVLKLFQGIPRNWLKPGLNVGAENAASYFGKISFSATSCLDKDNSIKVKVSCLEKNRKPDKIIIRVPHPDGLKALNCVNGTYDPSSESVSIGRFAGDIEVILYF